MDDAGDRCPRCGQSTTRRYLATGNTPVRNAAVPPPELSLPFLVPEARFMAGEVWTHGFLYLTDLGICFLAESDGPWTPERLITIVTPDPSKPQPVGPFSHYLPLNRIEQFQHSRLTSYSVVARDGKKPLRLNPEGWKAIDAYAAKQGIPSS